MKRFLARTILWLDLTNLNCIDFYKSFNFLAGNFPEDQPCYGDTLYDCMQCGADLPADGAGVALHVPAPHRHRVPLLQREHPVPGLVRLGPGHGGAARLAIDDGLAHLGVLRVHP